MSTRLTSAPITEEKAVCDGSSMQAILTIFLLVWMLLTSTTPQNEVFGTIVPSSIDLTAYFTWLYGGPMGQFIFDGKIYGLPRNAQIFGLYVDTPIMKKLGLQVPQT